MAKRYEEIHIPYPDANGGRQKWNRDYGLNAIYAGRHWAKRKADKDYWRDLVFYTLKQTKAVYEIFDKPVTISFWWNSNLDLDNNAYMRKLIIDGLKGTLIKDDAKRYVAELHEYSHDANYIKIHIEEADE